MFVSFIYIVAGISISFFIIDICSGLYGYTTVCLDIHHMMNRWIVSQLELLRITFLFPVMHSWVLFSIVAIYLKLLNQFLSKGSNITHSLQWIYKSRCCMAAVLCPRNEEARKPRDGEINKVDAREEVN